MAKQNTSIAGFALDVNVEIQVVDKTGTTRKIVRKHNRATKLMLEGMLNFLRGNFTTTYRQGDVNAISNLNNAKQYIPCYVGVGTGGIELTEEGIPNYNAINRRIPPVLSTWEDECARFSDTKLYNEIDETTRYEIGVIDQANLASDTVVMDSVQFVLGTDIAPNYFTSVAYPITTDIFITELGLFSTPTPNDGNLLARVVLHNEDEILYVRPQDTIILRWVICLISLNDLSQSGDVPNPDNNVDMSVNGINIIEEDDNNG